MTVEEYKTELERIEKGIWDLKKQAEELFNKHLQEHRKFEDGQKVVVITKAYPNRGAKEYIAFIKRGYVTDNGGIGYSLYKCKQDGTKSVQRLRFYEDIDQIKPF